MQFLYFYLTNIFIKLQNPACFLHIIEPFYLRIENAEGYVLIAMYLFIYLFVWVLFA